LFLRSGRDGNRHPTWENRNVLWIITSPLPKNTMGSRWCQEPMAAPACARAIREGTSVLVDSSFRPDTTLRLSGRQHVVDRTCPAAL
jgi:hypothetical protein